MTKAIAALIIIAALYCGWELFLYWDKVQHEQDVAQKQQAASEVRGESLPGLPWQLEASLDAAKRQRTAAALGAWLKTYGASVQDPRKAWIQLDYCLLISTDNPAEAKRIFADVKKRIPDTSPIWPRIKKLEKTYQ